MDCQHKQLGRPEFLCQNHPELWFCLLQVVQAAQIVAVEPHELLKSAEAMASVASRLVTCERDSSEEDWKSGKSPTSRIQHCCVNLIMWIQCALRREAWVKH